MVSENNIFTSGRGAREHSVLVYRGGFDGIPWGPTGWMGSCAAIELLTLDGDHTENPYEGMSCIKLRYVGDAGSWVEV